MNEEDAVIAAIAARDRAGISSDFVPGVVERRFIEVVGGNPVDGRPMKPGPVRDVLAFVVTLSHEVAFVEIAIDSASGEAVRILRSR